MPIRIRRCDNRTGESEGLLSFQALYDLIDDFTGHDTITAQILTKRTNQPDSHSETIVIKKGNRAAFISIADRTIGKKDHKIIEIGEYLDGRKQ